ncbi:MAG: hypothetical protein ABSA02_35000 [Trebonia sp.]
MLSFSPDFWPMFWMILIGAAVVTVALCFAIAVVPARRTARHHQPLVRLHRQRPARTLPHAGNLPHAA